ncbi:tautomerase family protein [Trinickia caryophylli]|uniref:Tautomerase enzyme n=1 Tax=Trinickia caryophylli TaxID=28094 RepID=A0A1X7EGG4_TRICW|nr:tautomerase family protein [Trinickia caryophylli]PMS11068.1 tautomerase family protein [Trinickia caryophylli]TRX15406.1 tautomerase family protein [Trinickia caryophylli]WQE15745.1 tautomerase family protein [Trinickia caryophylli]SMF33519.1 Tautomerase enzyme [Trinickia caryophylli]GLU32247.1 tautomerase family protein [Trinickia caryophylli]
MPLTRIALRAGKSFDYRLAIVGSVQQALVETFNVPEDDQFVLLSEHEPDTILYNRRYLGIERGDDFVVIQLTVSNTRSTAQKQALFRRIAELLHERCGLRMEDVFINLVEVLPENWSFGNGEAQYVEPRRAVR